MRPHGTPQQLEKRRLRAVKMLQQGLTITEVARRVGASHSSVIFWRDLVQKHGLDALKAKPASGRPPKLSPQQLEKIPGLLLKGALEWGYSTDLWTTMRIAEIIQRKFQVKLHRTQVGRLLARLNWSCQKPERRALERDAEAIARWKRYRWPAIKKKPGR